MPEVEYVGWGSRLVKSIGGVLVGIVLFLVAFPLLFWNEGRAVHRDRSLEEGASACVSVNPDKVDEANEGKLVYVAAEATTPETLTDPQFGVSAKALKLMRKVEIYQWVQRSETKTEKQLGGGEVKKTYYFHDKKWVGEPVSSSDFKPDDGDQRGKVLQNVGTKPYADATEQAKDVKLGAYKLTAAQVDRIGPAEKLPVTDAMLDAVPTEKEKGKLTVSSDGAFYLPKDPKGSSSDPQIGDVRITFTQLKPQKVSVIARQVKGSFEPWPSPSGSGALDELRTGILSKEAMFQQAAEENNLLTWILRVVGFALMGFGIFLVFQPFVVFADVIPFFGNLLSAGVALFAFLIALPLTLITIALGWVAYRPLIGIPLLVGGVVILGGALYLARRHKPAKADY
jgi:hypothetical protein